MNTLARICWITAPIYALIGMAYGIHMAMATAFTLAPAHAHLNLLGWVTIALYGTFYTLVPTAASSTLARIQVALAEIGVIVIVPGIALSILGQGDTLAAIGSIITILSMLVFVVVVVRGTAQTKVAAASLGQPI